MSESNDILSEVKYLLNETKSPTELSRHISGEHRFLDLDRAATAWLRVNIIELLAGDNREISTLGDEGFEYKDKDFQLSVGTASGKNEIVIKVIDALQREVIKSFNIRYKPKDKLADVAVTAVNKVEGLLKDKMG